MKLTWLYSCGLLVLAAWILSAPAFAQCIPAGTQSFDSLTPSTTAECGTSDPGTLPVGWTNAPGNTTSWRVRSGGTPSGDTGPSGDHTSGTGNYVYVETSCATGTWLGTLNLPCFDASGLNNPTFTFWYHMFGQDMGGLSLQIQNSTGGWNTVWSRNGDQGNSWRLAIVPVTPIGGEVRARFFFIRGVGFRSDCALDDISFGEPSQGGNCVGPLSDDFESAGLAVATNCGTGNEGVLPTGFTNDSSHERDWRVWSGPTPSTNTGPSGDHTSGSGQYLYVEASGCSELSEGILILPCFSAAGLNAPQLEFWLHMYGSNEGALFVEQLDETGNWIERWSVFGDQGDQWTQVGVSCIPVGGVVQLRMRTVRGDGFRSDVAIDDLRFGDPTPGDWEYNTSGARLSFNDVLGSSFTPAVLVTCPRAMISLELETEANPSPWEIGLTVAPNLPASAGGVATPGGQIVNLDISDPSLAYFFGGASPALVPSTNYQEIVFEAPSVALTISAQMLVVDASAPELFWLSQAGQLDLTLPSSISGPSEEDASQAIALTGLPLCGPPTIPFFGTSYSNIHVSGNGRITFGGSDVDWSPSPGEAAGGLPFVGFWTDLDSSAGTISVSCPDQRFVYVDFSQLPYFDEAVTATFSIVFDSLTGTVALQGLQGIPANPISNGFAGSADRQWLGISAGLLDGATDTGATTFAPGASGSSVTPSAMLYDYEDPLFGPATPTQLSSLQGGLSSLTFTPLPQGGYTWSGL